jgi:hypothetical protein
LSAVGTDTSAHFPLEPAGRVGDQDHTGRKARRVHARHNGCNACSDFTATVSVTKNVLTTGRVPICGTKGVYTRKASAKTLTLQTKADKNCPARAILMTGVLRKKVHFSSAGVPTLRFAPR